MSTPWAEASRFDRRTKVIAVADVVESVRLMEQDEHEFIRRWHGFVGFVQQQLPAETGRMHKSLGDGLMLEFSEPQGCIRAALAMQAWFREGNEGLPADRHVHLRIGAHIGEFIADEYDIYGTDVNVTARIATLAGPGEIVISAALHEHVRSQLDGRAEDLGVCHLKHLKHPVRAYRIRRAGWTPAAPANAHRVQLRATLAVLPFGTTASAGEVSVGEAVTDEVVAALAHSPELRVVSRLSTSALRDARITLAQIRKHLGAKYTLSGHARELDGQLSVFAELADVATGMVVWAGSFKGRYAELFTGDIAFLRELGAGVSSAVMGYEVEGSLGRPLHALESYSLLLAGVALMHRLVPGDMERAREMLEHQAERNPRHPAASAWMVLWHILQVQLGCSRDFAENAQLARDFSHAALLADPRSPLALCMEGYACVHLDKNLEAGAERYAQALALRPDDPLTMACTAEQLALRGDGRAARYAAQRALELQPLKPLRYFHDAIAASAALVAGGREQAIVFAERSLRANPRFAPAYQTLAMAQVESGQLEAARTTLRRLLQVEPGFHLGNFQERCAARPWLASRQVEALRRAGAAPGWAPTSGPAASS